MLPKLNFGALIAFLLPGFVGAYGLGYVFPTLALGFQSLISSGDTSAGPITFVLVTALAVGLVLSSVRSVLLDPIIKKASGCVSLDMSPLDSKAKMDAYQQALEQTYRYFQFTGNMACGLLGLAVLRASRVGWSGWGTLTALATSDWLLVASGALLVVAAYKNFVNTTATLTQVLSAIARAPDESLPVASEAKSGSVDTSVKENES